MKFRKKPVVIEATLYAPGMEDGWVLGGRYYDKSGPVPRSMDRKPAVKTLEGFHEITPGDWIITGIKGERYPCKPDIFAATYEPAESQPSAPRAEAVEAKDAQRLDWLERQFRTCSTYMDGNHRYAPTHGVYNMRGPTFRAAIDAAIAQGADEGERNA